MPDELAESDITDVEFDAMLAEGEPAEVTGPPAAPNPAEPGRLAFRPG